MSWREKPSILSFARMNLFHSLFRTNHAVGIVVVQTNAYSCVIDGCVLSFFLSILSALFFFFLSLYFLSTTILIAMALSFPFFLFYIPRAGGYRNQAKVCM